mgnify:CR=1 FL=1|jgi:hypothetical protein
MWKKTFIRSFFLGLVVLAGLMVFATTHPVKRTVTENCSSADKENCEKMTQGDFLIWESLTRTIMTAIQY